MNTSLSKSPNQIPPSDVGTLWTMRRLERQARCALIAWPDGWELRVLIDDEVLLTRRCPRGGAETFELAETWRGRMLHDGWIQIVPRPW